MAVASVQSKGAFTLYTWLLTAADPTASPTPLLGARSEKTVHVIGAGGDFNGATVTIEGTLSFADEHYGLLNSVPDTDDLSFTAQTRPRIVLPNVTRIKPVVTGTLAGSGVIVRLLVTSAAPHFY